MLRKTKLCRRMVYFGENMATEAETETQTFVNQEALPVESWINQAEGGQDMLTMILSFLQVPGHVLLVQGAPGTGKTTLAWRFSAGWSKGTRSTHQAEPRRPSFVNTFLG